MVGLSENWTRLTHLSSVAQHSSGGYTVRYFLAMRSLAIIGPTTSLFFRNPRAGQVDFSALEGRVCRAELSYRGARNSTDPGPHPHLHFA